MDGEGEEGEGTCKEVKRLPCAGEAFWGCNEANKEGEGPESDEKECELEGAIENLQGKGTVLGVWGKCEDGAEGERDAIAKADKEEGFEDTEESQQDEGDALIRKHEDWPQEVQDRVDKARRS